MISQSATRHKQMFTCGRVLIRFHRKDAEAQRLWTTTPNLLPFTRNFPLAAPYLLLLQPFIKFYHKLH